MSKRFVFGSPKLIYQERHRTAREPLPIEETVQFREVGDQQIKWKAKLAAILLLIRKRLITRALDGLRQLSPRDYHKLILAIEPTERAEVLSILEGAFREGRLLVSKEINRQAPGISTPAGAITKDAVGKDIEVTAKDLTALETVTDATLTQTVNGIQASAANSAASASILKFEGQELLDRVEKDLTGLSEASIDNQAAGAANSVINEGRATEMEARESQIDRFMYTCVLDDNSCLPCIDADQETGPTLDSVTAVPNSACEGRERCKCFVVALIGDSEVA